MPQFLLVGFAAGIASALLFASASAGGMAGRMLLFFLAPMPTYLAGLGWGSVAGAISAVVSALGAAIFLDLGTAAVFFIGHCLPAVYLCHLALLNRPVAADPSLTGGAPSTLVEWYPVGRILAVATLLAGALATMTLLLIGTDIDDIRKLMREFLDKVILKQFPASGQQSLSEEDLGRLSDMMLYALPAGAAVFWFWGILLNLWLGGKVTLLSGRLSRPWPDVGLMRFPHRFSLGLAATFAAAGLLSGYPALVATGFAGAFLFAYVLMGLAIIHYASRGSPARIVIILGVYLALFLLQIWAAVVVALIAILEPILPWRRPPEHLSSSPTD